MRRLNYIGYALLVICMPLAILLLSTNVVLRISGTYIYHFNDSQAVNELYTDVKGSEMAKEVKSYWNQTSDKEFQVYEKNSQFKDPIFSKKDARAMKKVKSALTKSLIAGLVLFAAGAFTYSRLLKKGAKKPLRIIGYVCSGITLLLIIIINILWRMTRFRKASYAKFVGVKLAKDSALQIILGAPFYKTFLLFFTVNTIVLTGILFYINFYYSKDKRLFS